METWRWTELLQMLKVTIIGSHNHVGSRALREVRHRLVDVFCGSTYQEVCICCLRLRLQCTVLFQHGTLDMIAQT